MDLPFSSSTIQSAPSSTVLEAASVMSKTNKVAFSIGDVAFAFRMLAHMLRTSGHDLNLASLKQFIFAPQGNRERIAALTTPFSLDPYVLRHIVHSIDGDYAFLGDNTFIPRDFDLWIRCATELGHRGDQTPFLFDKWFQGSALNTQPERYGPCPFGRWELFKDMEPHLVSRDRYPEQVAEMERIIDAYMAPRLDKVEDIGSMLRLLIWDIYCVTSYGEGPNEETRELLRLFEDHSPEFDYAVRMSSQAISYEWSDKLKAEVYGIGDWCWRVTLDRQRRLEQYTGHTDVLTNMLKASPQMDTMKMEGALRGVFTGGMNNCHSAVCGVLIANAQTDDSVRNYLHTDPRNIEYILREALRLFTAIPISRSVREEDNFSVDGKKLAAGTSIILSTYALNTDPRSWKEPLKFDPSRFEDTEELGFLCQRGFAPLGAAAELGGRQCGARYHDAHMLRTILRHLLRDYKFCTVGRGHFEMRQSAGTSMYAGHCKMVVQKRQVG